MKKKMTKIRVSEVNKILSKCRVSTKDDHLKLLMDINSLEFFVHRMKELIYEIEQFNEVPDKLIQVAAIYGVKINKDNNE